MGFHLGIDTSNYTTSAAVFDDETGKYFERRKLLPVKEGSLGLRQSDAVFHHTAALPDILKDLFSETGDVSVASVGVSKTPTTAEGSYMPCFLAGINAASAVSSAMHIPLFGFSHQQGHLAAALFSSGCLSLLDESFLAFHVSGGTTQVLLVKKNLQVTEVATSLDLKAGQAVDRVGVMLGYPFPAGKYVDSLACQSTERFSVKVNLKDGNCCLSGVENKCRKMFSDGEKPEDICRYCLDYICCTLNKMALDAREKYGSLPLVFSGGVMSNSILRSELSGLGNTVFAQPECSRDNAVGTAVLSSLKCRGII